VLYGKKLGPSTRSNSETNLEFHAPNLRAVSGTTGRRRAASFLIVAAPHCALASRLFWASRTSAEREHGNHDCRITARTLANTRFQDLDQVNPCIVKNLQVAWVFHTGVLDPLSELEARPSRSTAVYSSTDGHDDVFALNAATGKQLWKFDGFNDERSSRGFFLCCGRNNHGVAFGDGKVSSAGLTIPSWP